MWIIPNNLQLSNGAPDTEAFISDLNEQSQICASSLMVRSKGSPARTWSQKWKRDSWTAHLSGRILKPSHAKSFVTEWTCLWPVIHASHSPQQGSDSEQKTQDTSGHTSPDQFELFALDSVSSRMSKDTSALDSAKSLENWKRLVIKRRGEYSLRVKSAHPTNASGCSSWPTMHMGSNERGAYYDKTGKGQRYLSDAVVDEQKNWPSPVASEARQGFQDRSRGMKGAQESLTTVVIKHGPPAPANHSMNGSRQESWLTPRANEPDTDPNFAARNADRGEHCHGSLSSQIKQWATPRVQIATRDPNITEENREQLATRNKSNLEEEIAGHCGTATGKLNPRWVETLMGLPIGWTMPSCTRPVIPAPMSYAFSGMALCQLPPSEHSELF